MIDVLPGRAGEPLTYVGGSPARIFEQFALERAIDLIVVGSRGYGTVERVLLGSTSTALIGDAPCPVIVVPRPAERA